MAFEAIIGLDVSTTASKALVLSQTGTILASCSSPHTVQSPRPLWSEQDPHEWWAAVRISLKSALQAAQARVKQPIHIRAMGLTGQMHGLVLLDATDSVLRPCILWNDQRTQAQCNAIHDLVGREEFIKITGNVCLTGFTAPKLLWVKQHEPLIWAKVKRVLLPKDYIRFCLTKAFASDKAGAAGTVLFDLEARNWSDVIVNKLGIDKTWLPSTFEGSAVTGSIHEEVATSLGLATELDGTVVVAGGGDQSCQAVGMGVISESCMGLTIGTSGVIFAVAPWPPPLLKPAQSTTQHWNLNAFCHAVPGQWHVMGVMLSAAGSLQWYRDSCLQAGGGKDGVPVAAELSFDALCAEAEAGSPVGSDGLLFLPYLSGERCPHPDPLARGAFIGLTTRHTRAHMTRAVLEGVAFGLKDVLTLIEAQGEQAGKTTMEKEEQNKKEKKEMRISGGGATSLVWRQIVASVLDMELVCVEHGSSESSSGVTDGGAAFGAALLASVGVGVWDDISAACDATIKVGERTLPNPTHVDTYQNLYSIYRDCYPALKSSFERLSAFSSSPSPNSDVVE